MRLKDKLRNGTVSALLMPMEAPSAVSPSAAGTASNSQLGFVPARLVVLAAFLLPFAYISLIGWRKFYFESWGTWILSPIIYSRLLPNVLRSFLNHAMLDYPILGHLLCLAPVAILFWALAHGVKACHGGSLAHACLSFNLIGTVFIIYHQLQPMGMTYYVLQ